jgi:NADPH:quinone reductase-like Zn-dependent oxidoreductase/short-subunit dehydrogenase/acyl carrier protein
VLFVDRPQALKNDPVLGLTQSCDALVRIGKWAVRQTPPTPLFLLAAGGVQALHSEHPGTQQSADMLQAAALSGFARSLQNEWPELDIKIIDLGVGSLTNAQLASLTRYLADPDAETEMILNPKGQRLVPRVREITYPGRSSTGSTTDSSQQRCCQKLGFSAPGLLRNLHWQPCTLEAPLDAHEIRVEVDYTGLNFRDVMYALGMLADEALENGFSGPGLGLEFSGRILEVGRAVQRWSPGDRVMGFAPSSFATQLRTLETAVSAVPEGLGMDAAAALPTVFFTAWYALRDLARLEVGERVLIHGGAGGVGIAAIQIAQLLGAEIFATAGSPEKRDFLRLLGVTHVYDSRSLDFVDAILQETQGGGVDVVLNSLSGEAIRRNLQILRPFGRFLEIGKRDFFENTPMHLRPFRNNLSYFGIDADQLLAGRPALTRRVFQEVVEHFAQGALFPLPVTQFSAAQVVEAFRHMQQARHIGKVVVAMQTPIIDSQPLTAAEAPALALDPDGLYLVTGGTRGFGLATARRLVERGARHLLLISRSGRLDSEAQAERDEMAALGAIVDYRACDVSDAKQMAALFADIRAQQRSLRGIIHSAAVIEDGLAENLIPAKIQEVLAPKVDGAWHLHRLSLEHPLDFFVVYSSITTVLGNPGQSAYVAANTWLEGLAHLRRSQKLPALAVLWGPIADVGYLTRHEQTLDRLTQRLGGPALSAHLALDLLEALLSADRNGVVVANWDWQAVSRFLSNALAPRFANLSRGISASDGLSDTDLQEQIRLLPEKEAEALLCELVRREVAQILRLPPEKISDSQDLTQLGLDSLMGVELALALEERLGIKLPAFLLSEGPTADRLAQRLVHSLRKSAQEDGLFLSPDRETFEQLAKQHGVATDEAAIKQIVTNWSH